MAASTKVMRSFGDVVLGRYAARAAADANAFNAITKARVRRAVKNGTFLGPEWHNMWRLRAGQRLDSIAASEASQRRAAVEQTALEALRVLTRTPTFQRAYGPTRLSPRRLALGGAAGASLALAQ